MLNRIAYRLLHTAKDNPNQGRFTDNGDGELYLEYPTRLEYDMPKADKMKQSQAFTNFFNMLDNFDLYLDDGGDSIDEGIKKINKYTDELIAYLHRFKSDNKVLLQNRDNYLRSWT